MVKEFLSREGVEFDVKNVDVDEKAYEELIQRGYRTIPMTFIGEQVVKGFDEAALKAAIAARSSSSR